MAKSNDDDQALPDEMREIARYQAQAKTGTTILYSLALTLVETRVVTMHAMTIAFAECYVRMFRALMKYEAENGEPGRLHIVDLLNVLERQMAQERADIILETAPTTGQGRN